MGEVEMCGTCATRPIRYVRSHECANCYNHRWEAANPERVRASKTAANRRGRARNWSKDQTDAMPEFDHGKPITYQSAHQRVYRWRGKAAIHACSDCGSGAREWSYVGGSPHERMAEVRGPFGSHAVEVPYSTDPLDYVPLCRGCHVRRDKGFA